MGGKRNPQFYIYPLPIDCPSGCYWYRIGDFASPPPTPLNQPTNQLLRLLRLLILLLSSGIPTRACLPFVTLARNGVWALHHARHASCRGHASCAPFKRPFCHYLLHVRQHVHYERRSAVGATLRGGRGKLRGRQVVKKSYIQMYDP